MCRRIYAVVCGVWLSLVIDTGCAHSADHRVWLGESDFAVGQGTVPPDESQYTAYRRAGLTAFLQADYKQAENSFRGALAEARSFGPSDTRVVTVFGDLAVLYAKTRRFREAEELLQQSLTILQNNDPKHDLSVMLNVRAEVYLLEDRLKDAERTLAVAISLARNGRGTTDATVADILDNLGALQLKQKKYRQAEKSFEGSLEIRQKTPAAGNFNFAHALNGLGVLYAKQRRYSKAEEVLERSLKIAEADLPPYGPDLAFVLENLAVVENKLHHFEASETCFRRIVAIQTEERAMNRPELLAVYADTLRNVNKQQEASIVLAKMKRLLDQQRFIMKSNRPL